MRISDWSSDVCSSDLLQLDHPVDLPINQVQVPRLDGLEPALPQVEGRVDDRRAQLTTVHEVAGAGEVLHLDLQCAGLTTVGQPDLRTAGDVVGDLANRPDRVLEGEVPHHHALLDHPEHEVAAGHLEHRGGLAHVRITDDDVQEIGRASCRERVCQ